MDDKLNQEIKLFQSLWEGGFRTGYNQKRNQGGIEEYLSTMIKNKCVLEIGCGGGQWSKFMYDYVEQLYCVDILSAEHNQFWEYVGKDKTDKVHYIHINNFLLSEIPDDIIDFVFSYDVFCHISLSGIDEYIRNIYAKCKNGALLLIMYADAYKYFSSEPENIHIQENEQGIFGDHNRLKHKLIEECDGVPYPGRWYWIGTTNFVHICEKYGYEIMDKDLNIDKTNPLTLFKKNFTKHIYEIYNLNEGNIYYDENWCCPFTQLCEYEYLKNIFVILEDLLGDDFKKIDFYIYPNNGIYNPAKPIVIQSNKPRVLIYFSDETGIIPTYLTKYFGVIFKCYMLKNYDNKTIFPFPIGYHKEVTHLPIVPINERSINVFFSGTMKWDSRLSFYKELSPLRFLPDRLFFRLSQKFKRYYPTDCSEIFHDSKINFTSGFATGIPGNEYAHILYNSKIVLCPQGCTSSETFRHYEAMRAGCIIITSDLPDTKFYKNAPFIILKDWKKIKSTVRTLLMQRDKMQELHLATLDWWEEKCNEGAVAKYMTRTINKIIFNNY